MIIIRAGSCLKVGMVMKSAMGTVFKKKQDSFLIQRKETDERWSNLYMVVVAANVVCDGKLVLKLSELR